MEKADQLPNGASKIALLEEAIRIADLHLPLEQRFHARMRVVEAGTFSGHGHKAVVNFAWCLEQYDRNPSLSLEPSMALNYGNPGKSSDWNMTLVHQWVAQRLLHFPDIAISEVNKVFADLKRRTQVAGFSLDFYYFLKMEQARILEQPDKVTRYYEKIKILPNDAMPCDACTVNNTLEALFYLGRFDEAYVRAKPIFDHWIACAEVPHETYGMFLLPLLEKKRFDEAAECHRKGLSLIANREGFLRVATAHLSYLLVVNRDRAISLLEKYLPQAATNNEPLVQYEFYLVASMLLDELDEQARATIHFPDNLSPAGIHAQFDKLAAQFDQQSETDVFTQKKARFRARIEDLRREVAN